MDDPGLSYLILFIICLMISAFFSSAETSFIALQKIKLRHMVNSQVARAERVEKAISNPARFLAAILLGNNLVNVAAAALGTAMAASIWGPDAGVLIATLGVTVLLLIFCEVTPKTIAAHHAERLALLYVRPLEVLSLVLSPFISSLSWIASGFTQMLGEPSTSRTLLSEEEIRTAIDVGEEQGVVEEEEAEMLHKVFEFSDRPVREVMTPRTEVTWLELGTKLKDFLAIYSQSPHTRYPVYKDNTDNVVGTLAINDILMAQATNAASENSTIDDLVRPTYFVPETKPLGDILDEMQDSNYRITVVVDEFGGIAGIVTMEQLAEEIVGSMGDELGREEKEMVTIDEHTFDIDAGLRIEETNEELSLGLPPGDYDTLAGFVLAQLGHIPRAGEQVKHENLTLTVSEMKGMKIDRVRIVRREDTQTTAEVEQPDQ